MLNLIAYYINHKVATRGRYKGTSAHQRLTGIKDDEDVIQKILSLSPKKYIPFQKENIYLRKKIETK